MKRFENQVVWITGGGSGIGRALALEFAREGASIAVSGRRTDKLAETVREIQTLGARALAVSCDVMDETSISEAVRHVIEVFGSIDVVVANAGYSVMGRIEEIDLAFWKRQFDVNLFGLVSTVRAALPELRKTRGRVVLIGSVAAFVAPPKGGVYASSKAAVRMFGEALSAELKGSGVSCTTVHPAYVETDIVRVDNEGHFQKDRRDPRPKWLIWKADKAAKKIIDASYRRRREVVISAYGKVAVSLSRLFPGLLQIFLAGGGGSKQRSKPGMAARRVEMMGELRRMAIDRSPGMVAIYLRSIRRMQGRSQGLISHKSLRTLSPIEVVQPGVRIDPVRLERFRKVCESPKEGLAVPLAYPECLFLGTMAEAVLSDAFPLSPFGLIHIRQRIAMLRPIDPGTTLDLTCMLQEIRETERGFEVDFGLRANVENIEVWNGTTTVLSRNKQSRSGSRRSHEKSMSWISEEEQVKSFSVRVPEDTGRRYARASGDWNPHHLYPATARPLGYRRAIAHGMWTLARTLALIETVQPFAPPVEAEASFKRPIFLPSEIEIRLKDERQTGSDRPSLRFEVRDPQSGAPHMNGAVRKANL